MASSSTYAFNPAFSDVVLNALSRCGIRRTDVMVEHLTDAAAEGNLALVKFANLQPNLWTSETVTETLVASTATYTLNARVVAILAAYVSITSGSSTIDRIIAPISTTAYSAIPNKAQTGPPTQFWFNRKATPEVTLWPVPDSATTYTLNLQTVRQIQDASLPGGVTMDLPYRWLDAFTSELAARLARIYAPAAAESLRAEAAQAWSIAATQDVEDVPLQIQPQLWGYYR